MADGPFFRVPKPHRTPICASYWMLFPAVTLLPSEIVIQTPAEQCTTSTLKTNGLFTSWNNKDVTLLMNRWLHQLWSTLVTNCTATMMVIGGYFIAVQEVPRKHPAIGVSIVILVVASIHCDWWSSCFIHVLLSETQVWKATYLSATTTVTFTDTFKGAISISPIDTFVDIFGTSQTHF